MFRRSLLQTPRLFSHSFSSSRTGAVRTLNRTFSPSTSTSIALPQRFLSTETKAETPVAEGEFKAGVNGTGNGIGDASAENGGNGAGKQENGNGNGNGAVVEEIAKIKAELEAKTKEATDFKDRFLRSVAEFRNLQDRTARDVKSARDFAIQKFAKDIVETVDNIDRALSAVPEDIQKDPSQNKALHDLFQGIKMTESILLATLERHGLVKINPLGEKFDPNLHEAMFQTPVEGKEPGVVFHVQRTGFALNGRTLRAAQVGVVQAPPAQS